MSKLTDEQIDFIYDQVNNSQIDSIELKEDLIDHFCCVIEDYIKQGKSFEESYEKAYQIVCPNGFDEIYQETILLLTSKNIIIMKKLLFLIGFVTTVFLTTSFMFKALHFPGAGVLLGLSAIVLIFVLLPLLFLYFYKKEFSKYISYKMKYIFGYLGVALALTGLVVYVLHWPGYDLLFLLSVVVIDFGFLPFLFYRMHKISGEKKNPEHKSDKLTYIFGYLGVALFLTASVFKFHRFPFAAILLVLSVIVINFGFLPFLIYRMYKKSVE
ncbi:hypothetical protein ACFLU5_07295 [Bacteroidota bacterium]